MRHGVRHGPGPVRAQRLVPHVQHTRHHARPAPGPDSRPGQGAAGAAHTAGRRAPACTSTALVGAYVLAGELARSGGDHRAAFAAYEDVMRPYIAQAQELPPGGVNGFVPSSRLSIALRVWAVRMMNHWPLRN